MVLRKRILLADDPELLMALGETFLNKEGFELIMTSDAQEAFHLAEENVPGLIILELEMEGGGDACCRRLKKDPLLKPIPVILLVETESGTNLDRCRRAGADAVLSRPIDARALTKEACRLLNIVERASARLNIHVPVRCGADKMKLTPAMTINLTPEGAFIETAKLHPIDTVLGLEITLPETDTTVRCKARVAWVNHPEWVKKPVLPSGMGVQFLELAPSDQEAIKGYLTSLSAR